MAKRVSPFGSERVLQQRITGDVQQIAVAHEINRQTQVKRMLLHLFLMAKVRLIPIGSLVGFRSAQVQYITATSGDNAAHCLPCQILINGNTPQSFLESLSDELFIEVSEAFGTTDVIPVNFNKADSLSETKGLKEAFRISSERVVRLGGVRFQYIDEILPRLSTAFDSYKTDGASAYQAAITHMQTQILTATGAKRTEREERAAIIGHYRNSLRSAASGLETVMFLDPNDLWAAYRQIAPAP